jgi:cell division inhibitor SulA
MNTAAKTRTRQTSRSTTNNIIEIVSSHHAFPSTLLLSPFLKSASHNNHDRWMIFVNPPAHLDRDTLQKMGVDPTSILVLHSNTHDDALQLTERALANGKGHTIVSWLSNSRSYNVYKLENAADQGKSYGLIVRQR